MKTMLYLAMTAQELSGFNNPARTAYMACHFSPYGPGLANLPESLPEDAMVILNDRIPFFRHDFALIAEQLASLPCESILLDLQNTDAIIARELITTILSSVSIPVAVSEQYASEHRCAVFLNPTDADRDPFTGTAKWNGREIWLDLSPGNVCCRIGPKGCIRSNEVYYTDSPVHEDAQLLCHYCVEVNYEEAVFSLSRTWQDTLAILEQGKSMGITRGIGLYQEWRQFLPVSENK